MSGWVTQSVGQYPEASRLYSWDSINLPDHVNNPNSLQNRVTNQSAKAKLDIYRRILNYFHKTLLFDCFFMPVAP